MQHISHITPQSFTMSKYSFLNLQNFASIESVKNSFKNLILKHHPDKQRLQNQNGLLKENMSGENSRWLDILRAYETLKDPILKKEYDWSLEMNLKNGPVQEVVDLDDMTHTLSSESISCWKRVCRCGGSFFVTEIDLENGVDTVECDGCSLCIKLLYQQVDE